MGKSKKKADVVLYAYPHKFGDAVMGYEVHITRYPTECENIQDIPYFVNAFAKIQSKSSGLLEKIYKKLPQSKKSSMPALTKEVKKMLDKGYDIELITEDVVDGKAKHTKKKINSLKDLYKFYNTSDKYVTTVVNLIHNLSLTCEEEDFYK